MVSGSPNTGQTVEGVFNRSNVELQNTITHIYNQKVIQGRSDDEIKALIHAEAEHVKATLLSEVQHEIADLLKRQLSMGGGLFPEQAEGVVGPPAAAHTAPPRRISLDHFDQGEAIEGHLLRPWQFEWEVKSEQQDLDGYTVDLTFKPKPAPRGYLLSRTEEGEATFFISTHVSPMLTQLRKRTRTTSPGMTLADGEELVVFIALEQGDQLFLDAVVPTCHVRDPRGEVILEPSWSTDRDGFYACYLSNFVAGIQGSYKFVFQGKRKLGKSSQDLSFTIDYRVEAANR